jgi:hypothetical protein
MKKETPLQPIIKALEIAKNNVGSKDVILANHTYNDSQIGWYVAGSALNLIAAGKA